MKVKVTDIGVDLKLRTRPMEIEVQDNDGKTRGTLSVNKGYLTWRKAKHAPKNSTRIRWKEFIEYMEAKEK